MAQFPFASFEENPSGLSSSIPFEAWTTDTISQVNALQGIVPFSLVAELKADQNWNAIWEASFKEIRIGTFCQIRAPFHPRDPSTKYSLVINPRMAFGTGHHETTRLVIKALENLSIKDRSVVDFGAGTGILSMLASKMGARSVTAIECDPIAFENLSENIRQSDTPTVEYLLADNVDSIDRASVGLVLANITRNILLQHIGQLFEILEPGGLLVLSGFLKKDKDMMQEAVAKVGGTLLSVKAENEWIAIVFQKI